MVSFTLPRDVPCARWLKVENLGTNGHARLAVLPCPLATTVSRPFPSMLASPLIEEGLMMFVVTPRT